MSPLRPWTTRSIPASAASGPRAPNAVTLLTPANGRSVPIGSRLHEDVPVRRGDRAVEVTEAALVSHLARGVEQPGHRGAIERGGETDPTHAGRLELGHRERLALDAGHEVEGRADRAPSGAH